MSGVKGMASGHYPRSDWHRALISAGQRKRWQNADSRARTIAGMRAAGDDPLLRALNRARAAQQLRSADGRFK
jgi:hypothetical protein